MDPGCSLKKLLEVRDDRRMARELGKSMQAARPDDEGE